MSESTASIKAPLWQKMRDKSYRDNFVAAHLSTNIAAQIQTLREDRGWTQHQFGEKAGMTQARISIMEDPNYDKYSFSTLRRLASAFDVAFIARFAPFSDLAEWVADLSPQKLSVKSFGDDSIDHASQPKALAVGNSMVSVVGATMSPAPENPNRLPGVQCTIRQNTLSGAAATQANPAAAYGTAILPPMEGVINSPLMRAA